MIVHVALPLPIDKQFSYQVPDGWEPYVRPRMRVNVPLGSRFLPGFVVAREEGADPALKPVADMLDVAPPLDDATFDLCEWSARHYVTPLGVALKYAAPAPQEIERFLTIRALSPELEHLDGLALKKAYTRAGKLAIRAASSASALSVQDVFSGVRYTMPEAPTAGRGGEATLFMAGVEARIERYVSLIATCLDAGKNALMLLPDYHTAGQYFFRALRERLGERILWYSSAVPVKQRMEAFFRARAETGWLLLGNKSAAFLPVRSLGLIVVERPEENEYRNEAAFKFGAVRVALRRAGSLAIPFVAGSAAPPTWLMKLVHDGLCRLEERELPQGLLRTITVERRKSAPPQPPELMNVVEEGLGNGENIAIYTPRRDYASYLYCTICKKPLLCPSCSGVLTYRKEGDLLSCPACRQTVPYEETCDECGAGLIRFASTGVEYLEEHLLAALPTSSIIRVTGDVLGKRDLRVLEKAGNLPGTIIVGTQLLSKLYGLKVQRLVLVGWEGFFFVAGFRAQERMFRVFRNLVDALRPEHVDILVQRREALDVGGLTDPARFYPEELSRRKAAEFPPYGRLFLVQVEKRNREAGERLVREVEALLAREDLQRHLIGPLERTGRQTRWRMILKGEEGLFADVLPELYRIPGVRVEPDPTNV